MTAVAEGLGARQSTGAVEIGLSRLQGHTVRTAGGDFRLVHIFASSLSLLLLSFFLLLVDLVEFRLDDEVEDCGYH